MAKDKATTSKDELDPKAVLTDWWTVLGQHPTLMEDLLSTRCKIKECIENWLAQPLSTDRKETAEEILQRSDVPTFYLLEPAITWVMKVYPGLGTKAPPLPERALAFALGAVLQFGDWEHGLSELLARVQYSVAPVVAEVSITYRLPSQAQDLQPEMTRRVYHPRDTVLKATAHIYSSTDTVVAPDSKQITYVLRVPSGTSAAKIKQALADALKKTKKELGPPLDRVPQSRPTQPHVWMERYRYWWNWKAAEKRANRDPSDTRFDTHIKDIRQPLWSSKELQPSKDLDKARAWLGRKQIGNGRHCVKPLTLHLAEAIAADVLQPDTSK